MIKVKELGASGVEKPVYVSKPYVALDCNGVVVIAGSIEDIINTNKWAGGYYGELTVEPRKYDLYMTDNSKVPCETCGK